MVSAVRLLLTFGVQLVAIMSRAHGRAAAGPPPRDLQGRLLVADGRDLLLNIPQILRVHVFLQHLAVVVGWRRDRAVAVRTVVASALIDKASQLPRRSARGQADAGISAARVAPRVHARAAPHRAAPHRAAPSGGRRTFCFHICVFSRGDRLAMPSLPPWATAPSASSSSTMSEVSSAPDTSCFFGMPRACSALAGTRHPPASGANIRFLAPLSQPASCALKVFCLVPVDFSNTVPTPRQVSTRTVTISSSGQ